MQIYRIQAEYQEKLDTLQNQLKLRNFDTVEMREKINNLTNPSPEKNDSPKETVEPSKTEMTGSGEIQP